jgi:hypothetical protein
LGIGAEEASMRSIVASCALALALVATGMAAPAPGVLTTTAVHLQGLGIVLSWAPAAGATSYHVYRAIGDDAPTFVAATAAPFLYDASSPDFGLVTYYIEPRSSVSGFTYSGGECVYQNGPTISVTVSDCTKPSGHIDPRSL